MIKRIAIAAAFSLFYISMYPILIGGGVLQAWLCALLASRRGSGLFTQVGAGFLYAFSMMVLCQRRHALIVQVHANSPDLTMDGGI